MVKYTGRVALPCFFGKLEIIGAEHIPHGQPCIIAPNHQSAFLDSVLIGSMHPQPIHFLARADVFTDRSSKILAALNMMPIYRMRDGIKHLHKNEAIFQKCAQILQDDGQVVIYPEASMADVHYLRPLAKGISRMAFSSQGQLEKDLLILPIGVSYLHHHEPRYKCILHYGKPIHVRDYLEAYQEHPSKAIVQLKEDVAARIKELLILPNKVDYETKKQRINRSLTKKSFSDIRQIIENGKVLSVSYFPSLKWFSALLSIPNSPIIFIARHLLKKIGDDHFDLSIRFGAGLIAIYIWWPIVFMITALLFNWKVGVLSIVVCIGVLLLRGEIKKLISYPEYE